MLAATMITGTALADDMMKNDMMMKSDMAAPKAMMKEDAMKGEMKGDMMSHEMPFSDKAFAEAQKSGKAFLVAFHKKGCAVCAAQQQSLNAIYKDPAHAGLVVLKVDYDNDTASLKRFGVGAQSVLILFKGAQEVARSSGYTSVGEIEKQLAL